MGNKFVCSGDEKMIAKFIVYNSSGKILRTGVCPEKLLQRQAHTGEFVMEGLANDAKHKIHNKKIVNKTAEEIEKSKPKKVILSHEQKEITLTNGQYQDIINRLDKLEKGK